MANKTYPSDLSDAEWDTLKPFLPKPKKTGRPRQVDYRPIVNAIFYLVRAGCSWRMLPSDFPPWGTVHWYYRIWRRRGVFTRWNHRLREKVREKLGRKKQPSVALIDSQSVKTSEKGGLVATMQAKKSKAANAML